MNKEERSIKAQEAWQLAHDYDLEFGFCPQCVLAAVAETIGGISDDVIRSAHGLSGGGCLIGDGTCGALAGGLMALSAYHGRKREHFGKSRALKNLDLGKELIDRFQAKYDTLTCSGIQQEMTGETFDLWNEEETAKFKASACKEGCAKLTGDIAKWVVELI